MKTAVSRVNRWGLDRSGGRGSIPSGGAGTTVAAGAAAFGRPPETTLLLGARAWIDGGPPDQ